MQKKKKKTIEKVFSASSIRLTMSDYNDILSIALISPIEMFVVFLQN